MATWTPQGLLLLCLDPGLKRPAGSKQNPGISGDLYVAWDALLDCPVPIDGRWILDFSAAKALVSPGHASSYAEGVVRQARIKGTSGRCEPLSRYPNARIGIGAWTTPCLCVSTAAPDDGWYHIDRAYLPAYVRAIAGHDHAMARTLMHRYA